MTKKSLSKISAGRGKGVKKAQMITAQGRSGEESEERLHLIGFALDHVSEAVYWVNAEAEFFYVNEATCRSLGYGKDELLCLKVYDIDPNFSPEKWKDHWREVKERGTFTFETTHRRKDGTIIPVEITVNYFEYNGREYNFAFGHDITSRREADAALRKSEKLFRTLTELAPFGISIMGSDLRFEYFNPKFTEMLGYTLGDLPDKYTWFEKAYPDTAYREMVTAVWRNDSIDNLQVDEIKPRIFTVRCKSGQEKIIHFRAVSLRDGKQFLTYEDITSQIEAKEALQRSEERYRTLVDNANSIILRMDVKGNITFFNNYAQKYFGYTEKEILGRNVVDTIVPERGVLLRDLKSLIGDFEKFPEHYVYNEFENMRSDGERVWVAWTNRALYDQEGNITEIISIGNDITERRIMEERLRAMQQQLMDIIEFLPDATFVVDRERKVIAWNKAMEEMTGVPKEEMIGKGDYAYSVPFYGEKRPVLIDLLFKFNEDVEKKYHSVEKRGRTVQGEGFVPMVYGGRGAYFSGVAAAFFDAEGHRVGAIESLRDITGRKQAEDALRESESKLRGFLDNSPATIFLKDTQGRYLIVNKRLENLLQRGKDDIIGKTDREFFHPELARQYAAQDKEVIRARRSMEFDQFFRGSGGHEYSFITIKFPFFDTAGNLTAIGGIATDVSDRKQAEKDLANSERRLSQIIQGSPIPTFVIDDSHVIRYWNKACENLTGISAQEAIGTKKQWMAFYPSERPVMADLIVDGASEGQIAGYYEGKYRKSAVIEETYEAEDFFPVLGVNGKSLFFSAAPLKDVKGMLVGAIEVVQDISERKRSEEVQKKLEAQLQQAQKMEAVGTLAGGIAHDFNNLLHGIQGCAALMGLDLSSGHPHWEYVKAIEDMVERGADLTRQLLGFARGGKYEVKSTKLNNLIDKSSTMFNRTRKEIAIHRTYEKDLWTVEADQSQIEQVLLNLYVNSSWAMPAGGTLFLQTDNIILDASSTRPFHVNPGRYVKITVTDTGIGMDEATRRRIFEPFFTTKEMGRGIGLGLASAYGIVKNHGGFFEVTSEKGRGTAFMIFLPASEKAVTEARKTAVESVKGQGTILLVDDEEMVIGIGERLLKHLGYEVITAGGGEEALDLYRRQGKKINLVILDMIMPEMGGGETFDLLREINPGVKIILSSGYSLNGQAKEILERGCNGFIQKPFTISDLSQKIKALLDPSDEA